MTIPPVAQITFLIGNGFDKCLGMKTGYLDMYKGYIEPKENDNEIIKSFKQDLKNHKYDKWSDFEMGLAIYANKVKNIDSVIFCERDFKNYLIDYLINEEKKFSEIIHNNKQKYIDCFYDFFFGGGYFKKVIPKSTTDKLKEIENFSLKKKFISFNYTHMFDKIISDETIHIHGTIDDDVVIGLDNEKQFDNLNLTNRNKRAIIKNEFNKIRDYSITTSVQKIINSSSVICTFGLSLGESDLMWRNAIINRLASSSSCEFIYYDCPGCKVNSRLDIIQKLEKEEDYKDDILSRWGVDETIKEKIFDRLHIPVGFSGFNVPPVNNNK